MLQQHMLINLFVERVENLIYFSYTELIFTIPEQIVPHDIVAIPAFNDNYIWMIIHRESKQAVVIDPGESQNVLNTLSSLNLHLAAILITHHHWDHTDGIKGLVENYPVPVYGPASEEIPHCDHPLEGGEHITLATLQLAFDVIAVPGHTQGHIAYFGQDWLFCGDTLFAAGCGRLFEGTAAELYQSLRTLSQLPPTTRVYCAHEYTVNNLKFALTVDPGNLHVHEQLKKAMQLRDKSLPTLPSTIGVENLTNPFLRCGLPDIKQAVEEYSEHHLSDEVATFAALRRWKDNF